ncbi:MAG: hypothetical protein FWF51_11905 [Chitinivibrionia bacterium]|nr:hypothetical protein [Chitinivibrionia bacterium]
MKLNVFVLTKLLVSVFLVCGVMFFVGCSDDDDEKKPSTKIVGTWVTVGSSSEKLYLGSDGTFVWSIGGIEFISGKYTLEGDNKIKVYSHIIDYYLTDNNDTLNWRFVDSESESYTIATRQK